MRPTRLATSFLVLATLAATVQAAPPPGRGAGNPPGGRGNGRPPVVLPPPPEAVPPPSCSAVTSNGEELVATIRTLAADHGCGVLLVEHDMRVITGACDRVQVLDSGRPIAEGEPEAVRKDPAVLAAYLERWPAVRRDREHFERLMRTRRGSALELAQVHRWGSPS